MQDNLPQVDLELDVPKDGEMLVPDYDAVVLAREFEHYERYRVANHDPRWAKADELYFGVMQPKRWGTSPIPRSSLPYELSFDQVQAAYPIIIGALFGTAGDWYQVLPEPGTSPQEAAAQAAVMKYVLEHPHRKFGDNAIVSLKLAAQSVLHYGNGGILLQWNPRTNLPEVEWVDIRDIYVDPATPSPSVDDSRSVVVRKLFTVEQMEDYRDVEGFKIPAHALLLEMAKNRPTTMGDSSIEMAAAAFGEGYTSADAHLPSPNSRYVEVLIRYTPTKITWVLNRQKLVYNEKNSFGFIPLCIAPCYNVLRRFWAEGIPERQEHNQKIIQALINAHLDEVHLALNPHKVRKQGGGFSAGQFQVRPGGSSETTGNPKDDVWYYAPPGITANVFEEIGFFRGAAESRTGINSMLTAGVPMRSNASRTAAGIDAQTQGPLSRLQAIVQNIEDYLIVPMLYKLSRMLEIMAEEGSVLPAYDNAGQLQQVNSEVFKRKCRFTCLGSSKMLTREKLAGMLGVVSQFLLAGPFIQSLNATGQTVDMQTVSKFFQDATGTAQAYPFFRPLTQQEQQAMMQPPPQVQAMMQAKQMDMDTRMQLMDKKNEAAITVAALGHKAKADIQAEKSALEIIQTIAAEQLAKLNSANKEKDGTDGPGEGSGSAVK